MFRLSLLSAPAFPDPRTDIGAHEFDWSVVANATVAVRLAPPVCSQRGTP